jgi:hypothetical protein
MTKIIARILAVALLCSCPLALAREAPGSWATLNETQVRAKISEVIKGMKRKLDLDEKALKEDLLHQINKNPTIKQNERVPLLNMSVRNVQENRNRLIANALYYHFSKFFRAAKTSAWVNESPLFKEALNYYRETYPDFKTDNLLAVECSFDRSISAVAAFMVGEMTVSMTLKTDFPGRESIELVGRAPVLNSALLLDRFTKSIFGANVIAINQASFTKLNELQRDAILVHELKHAYDHSKGRFEKKELSAADSDEPLSPEDQQRLDVEIQRAKQSAIGRAYMASIREMLNKDYPIPDAPLVRNYTEKYLSAAVKKIFRDLPAMESPSEHSAYLEEVRFLREKELNFDNVHSCIWETFSIGWPGAPSEVPLIHDFVRKLYEEAGETPR